MSAENHEKSLATRAGLTQSKEAAMEDKLTR